MSAAPYYADESVTLWHRDCLDVLRGLPDNSVDAVVTDPPAGISFMSKGWDHHKGGRDAWIAWLAEVMQEALRVTKPGGHAIVWALPRTSHWTGMAIEDAGWEVRDKIVHLFGSGFPKSLDVSKAIDRAAGVEREVVPGSSDGATRKSRAIAPGGAPRSAVRAFSEPATPDAARWSGWGTALKPAAEDWWVARKPLQGTVAANVQRFGTGALNIDGCRVQAGQDYRDKCASVVGLASNRNGDAYGEWTGVRQDSASPAGRWPANVCLDHTQAAELDQQSGERKSSGLYHKGEGTTESRGGANFKPRYYADSAAYADSGGASRFFPTFRYEAKAPTAERPRDGVTAHPTVKPLDLMRWLVRLVTPPGGVVLEPFAGSGTTAEACVLEGFRCIAIEREADYLPLIMQRLSKPLQPGLDFGGVA